MSTIGNALNGRLFTYVSPTLNLKNTGTTTFFTTLATGTFIPFSLFFMCDTATLAIGDAVLNIGFTPTDYNDFISANTFQPTTPGMYQNQSNFGTSPSTNCPVSTPVIINVFSAESGTALTGRIFIVGFYAQT